MEKKLNVVLLNYTSSPEQIIALAAKLCYSDSDIESLRDGVLEQDQSKYLDNLIGMGHMSPIEHAIFTFGVEGISRAVSHQLVRHRIASYSQKSQRYVNHNEFDYIIPENIKSLGEEYVEAYKTDLTIINAMYNDWCTLLIKSGVNERDANDDARYVLPNATETKIIITMNARELMHFFTMRCCNRANWEIRRMAWEMLRLVKEVAPVLFKNAGPNCVRRNCMESKMSCGKPYVSI
jgi:thymidylate synthase (FAD)